MACPYQLLAQPVIKFCEPNICARIVQPANTWSNLAFIIVGIIILILAKNDKKNLLWWLGPITILIGLFSFAYHASYTFIGQMLDLGSMFLFATFLLIINIKRIKPSLRNASAAWLFVLINIFCLLLMYIIRTVNGFNIGILIFGIELAFVLALECLAWSRAKTRYRLGHILTALLIAAVAAVVWMFDYTLLWCNASTYHNLNGHALWHILTSASFVFVYLFYEQFSTSKTTPPPTLSIE